jgi:hypothetical protein
MIRIRNIDFETEGMKRHQHVALGDLTKTSTQYLIFSAPIDCVVENVKVVHSRSKSNSMILRLHLATATASTLVAQNNDTAVPYETVTLTPSANNSMTAGQLLALTVGCSGSDSYSSILVNVKYKPVKNRGTL